MSKTNVLHENILNLVNEKVDFFEKGAKLQLEEVGDGNVNYIFRVSDESENSLIVKFADDYIRGSDTRELSTKRNEIEYEILHRQEKLSKNSTPHVYHYSPEMNCIIMEDLKTYDVLREGLKNQDIYPLLAQQLSRFLYDVLFKTTDLVMPMDEKKELASHLVNVDMCEISERLVFTEPYMNNQGLNNYHSSNENFVEENLYNNKKLKLEVAKLKNRFMNNSEAMLHGDLHSGSIFVTKEDMRVFDPEFSFYGPMGYDIGNILASLLISYVSAYYQNNKKDNDYTKWLLESVEGILKGFINIYKEESLNDVKTYMFKNEEFLTDYLLKILADTAGYCGTEMIRRTVGVAKVWDLEIIQDHDKIGEIERLIITIGSRLIMERDEINSSDDFMNIIKKELVD